MTDAEKVEVYKYYFDECLKYLKNTHKELERLNAMVDAAEEHFAPLPFKNNFDEYIDKCKAEAINEFAERLKIELTTGAAVMRASTLDVIDNLVNELTEGNKDE